MLRARYLTNACILIETPDLRLLADPWFSEGAYDGSWFHDQPVEFCEPVDVIWVSHLHPDHYDPIWIREYLKTFPETSLLVAEHDPPYLPAMMRRHGLHPKPFRDLEIGGTNLHARTAGIWEFENIDSVLVVTHGGKSLVAWSDAPNAPLTLNEVRDLTNRVDLAFLPYSGAGPFPQCYDLPTTVQLKAAAQKADVYHDLWAESLGNLEPRLAVPYAGQYLLGGRFTMLNPLRGMLRPDELDGATVLESGQWVNVDGPEDVPNVEPPDMGERVASLAGRPMAYDSDPEPREDLKAGLRSAVAHNRYRTERDYWLGVEWGDTFSVNLKDGSEGWGTPRVDITVTPKHLAGLLSGRFHWNNAEIGSHLRYRQTPADQGVYSALSLYLSHLHV